ncbi:MAG: acyltransferase family protein [Dehalococcoidia bacterium]
MRYRAEIDGLRALAVIPVVLFHAGVDGFSGGFVGVDVFFVISGFLITSIIVREGAEGRFSLIGFWERRARRILPPMFVVIAFSLLVGFFLLTPEDLDRLGRAVAAQSVFSSNILFWQEQGYFGPTAGELPLLHLWSLAVEEQFYLLFPVAFVAVGRWLPRLRWALVAGGVMASFLVSLWATEAYPKAAFFLMPPRAWELGAGALLAMWVSSGRYAVPHRLAAEAASGLGVGLIAYGVFTIDEATPFPGTAAIAPVLGATAVIWANSGQTTRVGTWLSWRPLVFTGLISYALYLWHWPLLVFAAYPSGGMPDALHPLLTAGVIALSVGLAVASYRLLETPIRRRVLLPSRRLAFGAALGALAVAGAVGFSAVDGNAVHAMVTTDIGMGSSVELSAADPVSERQGSCNVHQGGSASHLESLDGFCSYGDDGTTPQFVLWGDSHALALAPAFDEISARTGVGGLHATMSACPPAMDVKMSDSGTCEAFNEVVRRQVIASGAGTVVLAGVWSGYYDDDNFVDAGAQDQPGDIIAERLRMTVLSLLDEGLDVWVVRDGPRFDFDPQRRMYFQSRLGRDIDDIGRRSAEVDELAAPMDELFRELAVLGVQFVDLPSVLCEDGFCPAHDGSQALYDDDHHLSAYGALRTVVAFQPLVEALVGSTLSSGGRATPR